MSTLAEFMIVAGADNRPPMLDKTMYNSWQSRMLLYLKGKKNGRMMLESIENGPLVYPTIEENGAIRPKKYTEHSEQEKLQDDYDVQALNIVLQGLPLDVYALVNHCESLHEYYLRFSQLINDMHTIGMTMQQVQVNTKFLNVLQPEWSKFVTDVKLAKNMYTTNFDQLFAYLNQHEGHANEVQMMRERYPVPLALVTNYHNQVKGTWQGSAHSLGGPGTLHGLRKRCCWLRHRKLNDAFQTDDLDAYDSDYDDISSAKAVLMAKLSSYDLDVLSEVPYSDTFQHEVINQSVPEMSYFKQTAIVDSLDNEITSDSNIIHYSQYLQESQQAVVQDTNSSAQQDSMIISMFEQISEQMSNQVTN
ncbi:hypothetical protein Tco_1455358 [Tanacetum coccineum]